MIPTLLHPKSVGEIKLKSTDPLEPPAINPHYLEDHRDVQVLIQVYIHCIDSKHFFIPRVLEKSH